MNSLSQVAEIALLEQAARCFEAYQMSSVYTGLHLSRLGQQTRQKMNSKKDIVPAPLAALILFDDLPMSSANS